MKFIKPFLIIFSFSSLGLTFNIKRGLERTDFKCRNAVIELQSNNDICIESNWSTDDEEEIRKFCHTIETPKCQKYYNIKLIDIPECKTSDKLQLIDYINFEYSLNDKYQSILLKCSRDEQGNFCPLSSIEKVKRINSTMTTQQQDENYDIALKDTCKSQKCVHSYLSRIESLEKGYKENPERIADVGYFSDSEMEIIKNQYRNKLTNLHNSTVVNMSIDYFKSDECAMSSNANISATYSSILFIILSLLLFIYKY